MPDHQLIGTSVLGRHNLRSLRGAATFVDDIRLPGMQFLSFVRSPHPHAHIVSIVKDSAVAMKEVRCIVAASDLGLANEPLMAMVSVPQQLKQTTQRPLADNTVRFVGEAVAAVLATSRESAVDAADGVRVRYDLLPAVIDPLKAHQRDAPQLHPHCRKNEVGVGRERVGDPERAFARADLVVGIELDFGRSAAQPMEPRGVVANYDPILDLLTIWSGTQVPHRIRIGLAQALRRPEESIRIIAPDVGGAFGSKLCLYPEEVVCAFLALKTGKPVKWIETRHEHFLAAGQGRGQHHHIELALRADGTLLALRDRYVHDNGAYTPYGLRLPVVTLYSLMGPYRVPNFEAQFISVFTNKPPIIPYRGAGQPEAVFALERAMDLAAQKLAMEGADLRRRNLIASGEFPYNTRLSYPQSGPVSYDAGSCVANLDAVTELIDLAEFRKEQKHARLRGEYLGLGIACYMEGTGAGSFEGSTVRIDSTGTVTVFSGICSQGQGHETILAQVCADILHIPMTQIRVRLGDTAGIAYGVGTWGSRAAAVAGPAVAGASTQVRKKVCHAAATLLEADPADIRWEGENVWVAGTPEKRVRLGDLALAATSGRDPLIRPEGPGLEATYYFSPPGLTYASGVHAAVARVNVTSGQVKLLRYIVAHDCGRLLNPKIVEGQIIGGAIQGIGGALLEELVYDEQGQSLIASFADYAMPRATHAPAIEIHHLETPSTMNPLGIRGAGESGTVPVYAAVAGAVEDALTPFNVRIDRVPIPPRLIYAMMQGRHHRAKPAAG